MQHNSGSSCQLSNSSFLPTSQLDFLSNLELTRIEPIKTRDCFVMIQASKCSFCKREFKCITDTENHMRKKHLYVKRKTDSKLVRVMFKMGKETFCDHKIYRKYLKAPYEESEDVQKSSADCNVRLQTENYKPVKNSEISHQVHKTGTEDISKDLIAKGSVPLSFALMDMISLEATAVYKNGRVYRGKPMEYSDSEEKENQSIVGNSRTPDKPSTSNTSSPGMYRTSTFPNTSNTSSTLDFLSTPVTPPRTPSSPTSSDSEASTIIYLSDVEMDLTELYEDVKPRIPKIEMDSDSDDGEISIIKTFYKNDFNSVCQSIEKTEGARAAFDAETIMRAHSSEMQKRDHVKTEPAEEPIDVIDIDDSDIEDSATVILSREGENDLAERLATLEEEEEEVSLQSSGNVTTFISKDKLLEGLEEGDQDIHIIEEVEQLSEKPNLQDFLEEAVLKYVEMCETASTGDLSSDHSNLQSRQTRIANLKNSPLYNSHLRRALQHLAIKITPPSLVKIESDSP